MMQTVHRFDRVAALIAAIMGAMALSGCQGPPSVASPERSVADATGLSDAIVFRTEGAPLDELDAAGDHLSLAEAVRRAVTTDPGLQASLARTRIALAEAHQARLWPNPVLNLALRWPGGGGSPIVEASLAQDLIAILRTPRRTSAADHRLRQAAAEAVTVALDVATQTQERYASAQALDALLPTLHERRALLDQLIDLANARLDAGEGTRQDLIALQAQRIELDVHMASMHQQQRDERLRLTRLIGEPSGAAAWALDDWTAPSLAKIDEAAWIEAALHHRPEIQAAQWRLAALGDELALAGFTFGQDSSGGVQAERDGEWSIGPEVSLPLPIFDLGQARVERAEAQQVEARHELTQARRMVVEEVRREHESLIRAGDNVRRIRDELIPVQHERRAQAEALFRAGERDAIELRLTEQDVLAAQSQAVEMERAATIAQVRLQRAVGGSVAARHMQITDRPELAESFNRTP